jgi:hypothetical protein
MLFDLAAAPSRCTQRAHRGFASMQPRGKTKARINNLWERRVRRELFNLAASR